MSQNTVKPYGVVNITLPETWGDRSIYTFVGPEQTLDDDLPTLAPHQGFRPNVVVTREPADGNLESYAEAQLAASRNQLPDFKLLEERALSLSLGPAVGRKFTLAVQGTTVQQWQVFTVHDGFVYTLTFSTLPAMADENQPEFEAILQSAIIG